MKTKPTISVTSVACVQINGSCNSYIVIDSPNIIWDPAQTNVVGDAAYSRISGGNVRWKAAILQSKSISGKYCIRLSEGNGIVSLVESDDKFVETGDISITLQSGGVEQPVVVSDVDFFSENDA